jgi:hypothetical protein
MPQPDRRVANNQRGYGTGGSPGELDVGLNSRLFKGDSALEKTLVSDAAHVTPGSIGNRVWKIQAALLIIDDYVPPIALTELAAKHYGPSTTAAVVAFKTKWEIINKTYEDTVDPIVGKMTIGKLDEKVAEKEAGEPSPGFDPQEAARIQTLLDRDRPGVRLMVETAERSLLQVKQGFDKAATDPNASARLLAANALAVDALARMFHVGVQNYRKFLPQIIAQYGEYKSFLANLARNQRPADFLTLVKLQISDPQGNYLTGGQVTGKTPIAVSETADTTPVEPPRRMYFTPRYREFDPANPPEFIGQFPQVRQGIQMHEMGHFHFNFIDFNPDRKSPEECLSSNRSYELLARQVTFGRHEPTT